MKTWKRGDKCSFEDVPLLVVIQVLDGDKAIVGKSMRAHRTMIVPTRDLKEAATCE